MADQRTRPPAAAPRGSVVIEDYVEPRLPFHRYLREVGWRHLVGLAGVAFALFPIVWIISGSINTESSMSASRFIPEGVTTENYRGLFNDPVNPFHIWLWNSFKIAFIVSFLQLVMSAAAAYAFARLRWAGRRLGLLTILLIQMFPQFLAFVALFLMLDALEDFFGDGISAPLAIVGGGLGAILLVGGLLVFRKAEERRRLYAGIAAGAGVVLIVLAILAPDFDTTLVPGIGLNQPGLMLVYLGGAIGVNTWMMKGFFDSIPMTLDESARVDGATDWQIFSQIIIPLARPVLAVIFVITFVFIYNEFIIASLVLSDVNDYTFAIGLNLFVQADFSANWGRLTAAAVLGGAPIVLVYLVAQDFIVGGLTQGAVKG
jgi:arabinogalactan oligomer/maltooligosaccharide transport system permease protein